MSEEIEIMIDFNRRLDELLACMKEVSAKVDALETKTAKED